ncbi:MAG: hypothetical protein PHE60_10010 [Sulfurospirillaceae bacterium]|nr:hypothetical protein [Sulfurospirillaceae bacterium]
MKKIDLYAIQMQLENISNNLASINMKTPLNQGFNKIMVEKFLQHDKDVSEITNFIHCALKYIREKAVAEDK